MSDDHPGAGSYLDRHGKRRWRFRRGKKVVQLPHAPGHPEFEAAYMAAVEGREHKPATVHRLPTAASPRSLKACWRLLKTEDPEWQALGPDIKTAQTRIIERFLTTPVVEGETLLFGEVDVADLKRGCEPLSKRSHTALNTSRNGTFGYSTPEARVANRLANPTGEPRNK